MHNFIVLKTTDNDLWIEKLQNVKKKHLVHYPQYMRIFEYYEGAIGECFVFESEQGIVIYPYLRRLIPYSESYADLVTPYGYGGPIFQAKNNDPNPIELIKQFCRVFDNYAIESNTVSQFIRFHPVLQNQQPFIGIWDGISFDCSNALILLDKVKNSAESLPIRDSFKRCINQAKSSGLLTIELLGDSWIVDFFKLYSESMDRKKGSGYFRFSMEFIRLLTKELGLNVKCFSVRSGSQTCAFAIFLSYDEHLEYFLAASDPTTLHMHPNHMQIYDVCNWALENQVSKFHLGGGGESLLFFKRGFANSRADYFIGRNIFNYDVYTKLTKDHYARNQAQLDGPHSWFPEYRREFI
jgi:hypothetical protein